MISWSTSGKNSNAVAIYMPTSKNSCPPIVTPISIGVITV